MEEQYLPVPGPSASDLEHLPEAQQSQVRFLSTPDVRPIPAWYSASRPVIQHHIALKEKASIRRMIYQIPERLLGPLKKKIDLMLSMGIIEVSQSE